VKPVTFHTEAESELRAGLNYYEEHQPGLGGVLLREFESALQRLCDNPLAFAMEEDVGVRYCPLHQFPISIVYVELEERIWIVAIAHQHRRPLYWAKRKSDLK